MTTEDGAGRSSGDTARPRRTRLPFASLRGYRRSWLGTDVLAGIMLLVIAVPEQLATSRLAGMPPITGLFTFVAGAVVFAAVGSNPQLSVGADSTIAPLFAVGIGHLAATGSSGYLADVGLLAVMVGAIVALVGLLRLGWIADFLSAPIITGFLAGVAVIIVVHQLPDLLGLPSVNGSTVHRLDQIGHHLGATNGWAVGIGVAVFVVVVGAERLDRRIPGALIGLVGSTVVVGLAGLTGHGVAVLGPIAHGAPQLGLRLSALTWTEAGRLGPIALVVALVVLSQTAATTRAFADQGGYGTDVGIDFIGVGAGSMAAGLVGGFPANASPGRTGAVAQAGGKTQMAGILAAVVTVGLIPAAGILRDLPDATLAAVLIYVASRLFHVKDLRAVLRFDHWEFALAVLTLLTVALVGVEQGIAVAVGLAIVDRTRLAARPRTYVLGRIPNTTSWEPLHHHEHPREVPGVVVFLFAAPLYFANAGYFRLQVHRALATAAVVAPTRLFVLDAAGAGDIDFTGARALGQLLTEFEREGVTFAVARAYGPVPENLRRSGLLETISPDHLFHTVDAAVTALAPSSGEPAAG